MAVSKTGELMGAILNAIIYRENTKESSVHDDSEYSKYNNISILLNKIQQEIKIFKKYPNVDKILRIMLISVNNGYRRQGICKALIEKTKYI